MYVYLDKHLAILFVMFAGNVSKTSILAAFKSIQDRTCIKFKESKLDALDAYTFTVQEFAVVFSTRGNRYICSIMLSV